MYNKVNVQYVYSYVDAEGNTIDTGGIPVPVNVVANPQPGDQTIQDIYQNIFDNWNKEPGTYQLAGISTATNGTRTALQPSTLNQGVLKQYSTAFAYSYVDAEGNTINTGGVPVPVNQLASVQPLYENLGYTRYRTTYAYTYVDAEGNTIDTGGVPVPVNEVDPVPFKQDAFDYVFTAVTYQYTYVNAEGDTINTGGVPVPVNTAGRVPQPYTPVRVTYVYQYTDAEGNVINTGGVPVPVNVPVTQVVAGQKAYLTLDISNDPDSPVLTMEDDVHTLELSV